MRAWLQQHKNVLIAAAIILAVLVAAFVAGGDIGRVPQPPASSAASSQTDETPQQRTCRVSVSCRTVLQNMDKLDESKVGIVPADGWLLPPITVAFEKGESAFDVIKRVCREQEIPLEFSLTPGYDTAYIEGIGHLYEFDCGSLSGWMYLVNGAVPQVGCSAYTLQSGDVVEWAYTCSLGADLSQTAQ